MRVCSGGFGVSERCLNPLRGRSGLLLHAPEGVHFLVEGARVFRQG